MGRRSIHTAEFRDGVYSDAVSALYADEFDDLMRRDTRLPLLRLLRHGHAAGGAGHWWASCGTTGTSCPIPGTRRARSRCTAPRTSRSSTSRKPVGAGSTCRAGPSSWTTPMYPGRATGGSTRPRTWSRWAMSTGSTFPANPPPMASAGRRTGRGRRKWVDYMKRHAHSGITFASWPKWRLFGFESDPEGALQHQSRPHHATE